MRGRDWTIKGRGKHEGDKIKRGCMGKHEGERLGKKVGGANMRVRDWEKKGGRRRFA
jgi:hypothetical protein